MTHSAITSLASPTWLTQHVPEAYADLLKGWSSNEFDTTNVSLEMLLKRMAEALRKSPDYLGCELGWQLQPTAYGDVGLAMMCSSTLSQCLELLEKFAPLVSLGVSSFDVTIKNDRCTIHHMVTPWVAPDIQNLWNDICLFSWRRSFHFLLEGRFESLICLNHPAPEKYDSRLLHSRFGEVRFDQPECSLSFPVSYLHEPLLLSNQTTQAQALARCEQQRSLSHVYQHRASVARVKSLLQLSADGYPTVEILAQCLHVSARTLRRHLAAEGFSYSVLLEQARARDAAQLLSLDHLSIQKVAETLGYSDSSNFARDFRQWVGVSPSVYRKQIALI